MSDVQVRLAGERLVTLTGMVSAARHGWRSRYPAVVPQTVATVLNMRETPGQPIVGSLATVLRKRTLLLVLDNCEHLLDACAQRRGRPAAGLPRASAARNQPRGQPGIRARL